MNANDEQEKVSRGSTPALDSDQDSDLCAHGEQTDQCVQCEGLREARDGTGALSGPQRAINSPRPRRSRDRLYANGQAFCDAEDARDNAKRFARHTRWDKW
jgi:hypothetical protein